MPSKAQMYASTLEEREVLMKSVLVFSMFKLSIISRKHQNMANAT